jgi:hypothetical protein
MEKFYGWVPSTPREVGERHLVEGKVVIPGRERRWRRQVGRRWEDPRVALEKKDATEARLAELRVGG